MKAIQVTLWDEDEQSAVFAATSKVVRRLGGELRLALFPSTIPEDEGKDLRRAQHVVLVAPEKESTIRQALAEHGYVKAVLP